MTRVAGAIAYKSPLHEMTQTTPTCLWQDSASIQELTYSIEHGGVGATCNPVIVLGVLKKEMAAWKHRIREAIEENPHSTGSEIGWQLVREVSAEARSLLRPAFESHQGRNARLSIHADPRFHRDTNRIVLQAEKFSTIAPNMIVKIPVTRAGIPTIEEPTYRGISIKANVCLFCRSRLL
jgi:transaldolase